MSIFMLESNGILSPSPSTYSSSSNFFLLYLAYLLFYAFFVGALVSSFLTLILILGALYSGAFFLLARVMVVYCFY